jgi:alanine dehydrogenase
MRVGVPKERKPGEARVAITPAGVRELVARGHEVLVEGGAGAGSRIADDEFAAAGAHVVAAAAEVFEQAALVVKVKEPSAEELGRLRAEQVLFTFLHLAAYPAVAGAPKLVGEDLVKRMRPGSVLVDISIDQGGTFGTSRETTHADPVYTLHGVVHYAVGNIPGAVPHTSTWALTNATLPYVLALAAGLPDALERHPELVKGVNVARGTLTHPQVAEALGQPFRPAPDVLGLAA